MQSNGNGLIWLVPSKIIWFKLTAFNSPLFKVKKMFHHLIQNIKLSRRANLKNLRELVQMKCFWFFMTIAFMVGSGHHIIPIIILLWFIVRLQQYSMLEWKTLFLFFCKKDNPTRNSQRNASRTTRRPDRRNHNRRSQRTVDDNTTSPVTPSVGNQRSIRRRQAARDPVSQIGNQPTSPPSPGPQVVRSLRSWNGITQIRFAITSPADRPYLGQVKVTAPGYELIFKNLPSFNKYYGTSNPRDIPPESDILYYDRDFIYKCLTRKVFIRHFPLLPRTGNDNILPPIYISLSNFTHEEKMNHWRTYPMRRDSLL